MKRKNVKRAISLVLSLCMILTLFASMSGLSAFAVDNTPAPEKLPSYHEYRNMHKTTESVCRIKYVDNEIWDMPYSIYDMAVEMYPERYRTGGGEWGYDYYLLTEEEIFDIARALWPYIADDTLYELCVLTTMSISEFNNGFYEVKWLGGVGVGYVKLADYGEFQGFTINPDGSYSFYYIVTPWEDAENVLSAEEYEECLEISKDIWKFEYKGRKLRFWYWLQIETEPETRVFNYRLVNGKVEYISDEFGVTIPDDLLDVWTGVTKDDVVTSGKCGNNANWNLNTSTGELTISGSGKMTDYSYNSTAPWCEYFDLVKTVNITSGITSIGNYAFSGCTSLTSITIPDSVTSIGYDAFDGCTSLTSITIPNSVTTIGSGAFEYCASLTSIKIPDKTTIIDSFTFYNCTSLESIFIPDSITSIDADAFQNCTSLESITIPDSVKSIGDSAFGDCTGLNNIILSNGLESIDWYAFSGCNKLEWVYYNGTPAEWNKIHIGSSNDPLFNARIIFASENYSVSGACGDNADWSLDFNTGTLTVSGSGEIEHYTLQDGSSTAPWSKYGDIIKKIVIEGGITEIGNYAFYGLTSLSDVNIPGTVINIHNYVFYNCIKITNIYIGSNVQSVGDYAFAGCTGLVEVNMPKTVININSYAFSGCYSLKVVRLSENLKTIGNNAFSECHSITNIAIPKTVEIIDTAVFYNCVNLTNVIINSGTKVIGDYAFYGCESINSIKLPDTVINIGKYAYYNCKNLTYINFGRGIKTIDEYGFGNCTGLTQVNIPDSVINIYNYAFINDVSITNIYIGDGLEFLGDGAFDGCKGLSKVKIESDNAVISAGAIPDFTSVLCNEGSFTEEQLKALDSLIKYIMFLLGDYNKDDEITDQDAIYLLYNTYYNYEYPIYQSGDINGDGTASDQDAIYLLFHYYFPDTYPLFDTNAS